MTTHRRPIAAAGLVLALLLVACGGSPKSDGSGETLTGATAPPVTLGGTGPLAKVRAYDGLDRNHVNGDVRYRQTPPVGGDHNQIWANCGFYTASVASPFAVHAMEHGAVWITFRPDLPADQQSALRGLIAEHPYVLISPWSSSKLADPIVLSAWGRQIGVATVTDPAVAAFLSAFEEGPQAPERGGYCTGGVGTPAVVFQGPTGP